MYRQCSGAKSTRISRFISLIMRRSDMSWEVINSFDKKFPGKFSIAKNNRNKGAQFNYRTWFSQISSDYRITLNFG